jgi:hypothetical protein
MYSVIFIIIGADYLTLSPANPSMIYDYDTMSIVAKVFFWIANIIMALGFLLFFIGQGMDNKDFSVLYIMSPILIFTSSFVIFFTTQANYFYSTAHVHEINNLTDIGQYMLWSNVSFLILGVILLIVAGFLQLRANKISDESAAFGKSRNKKIRK